MKRSDYYFLGFMFFAMGAMMQQWISVFAGLCFLAYGYFERN